MNSSSQTVNLPEVWGPTVWASTQAIDFPPLLDEFSRTLAAPYGEATTLAAPRNWNSLAPGKPTKNHGTSPFFMGKSTK